MVVGRVEGGGGGGVVGVGIFSLQESFPAHCQHCMCKVSFLDCSLMHIFLVCEDLLHTQFDIELIKNSATLFY